MTENGLSDLLTGAQIFCLDKLKLSMALADTRSSKFRGCLDCGLAAKPVFCN